MLSTLDSRTFSMMNTNTPYKSYKKVVLAKVYVTVLNSFNGQPEGIILHGNPRNNDDSCIVDMWSEMEDVYFRRANKRHLETGDIREFIRKEVIDKPKTFNEFSDDELRVLVNSKFLTLQHAVNKMDSVATVYRLLNIAEEEEKSEKIMAFIKGKLSELQLV